jgi:FkbM family methyltransferase
MGFTRKKGRLLGFLARRIRSRGWPQFFRGLRERRMSYVAMELAGLLPPHAATIVDVGAHSGLLAEALDFLYSPSRLWAVEPNPAHRAQLDERFRGRPQVVVVGSCLGEASGEVAFNAYEFDAASSVFECVDGHMASLGLSERSNTLTVPMTTLRELMPRDLPVLDLLKIDCQGGELSVLKGAGERIRDIRWVYCEVSFDPIYKGAPLWAEVHSFLRSSGFELRGLSGFSGAGPSIQWADALYANSRLAAAVTA